MNLIVIPARKGSKRLPGKNFREFCGSPLWFHTANQATAYADKYYTNDKSPYDELKQALFIVLSTDQPEDELGALLPEGVIYSRRPDSLCQDTTTTEEVVEFEARRLLNKYNYTLLNVIVLQPTSPLRSAANIDDVVREAFDRRSGFAYSSIAPNITEPDGRVYVVRGHLALQRRWTRDEDSPIITGEPWRAVDIDTEEDFQEAARRFRTNGYMFPDPEPEPSPNPKDVVEFDSAEKVVNDASARLRQLGCSSFILMAADMDTEGGYFQDFLGEVYALGMMEDMRAYITEKRWRSNNAGDNDGDEWKQKN